MNTKKLLGSSWVVGLPLGAVAIMTFMAPTHRLATAADPSPDSKIKVVFDIEIKAGELERRHSPASATLTLPATLTQENGLGVTLTDAAGKEHSAQLTEAPLLAQDATAGAKPTRNRLNFIVDHLARGASEHWAATIASPAAGAANSASASSAGAPGFEWCATPGDHIDLEYRDARGERPVLRYMNQPLDESSKEARSATFKVYHHVFDPSGVTLLTKGVGGEFTHHRGLFFGFNKVSYDGGAKKADVWHCTGDAFQSHDDTLASEAGPVLGRHRLSIGWHGPGKETFAEEHRELTAYAPPSAASGMPVGTLVEFATRVRPVKGEVKLDGDPQHAGFHFRASQEVSERATKLKREGAKAEPQLREHQTYFLRPNGIGKPGETRNWDVKNESTKGEVNYPWKGMSFVVADHRYTVAYLDRPTNPKESRFSERDYGRFGSYFEYTMTAEHPLELNYRVWIQPGEMKLEDIAALDEDFNHPIEVVATAK